MFSIGEIGLTSLIGLFVLGPQRMVVVVKTVRKYWAYVNNIIDKARAEFNEIIDSDDDDEASDLLLTKDKRSDKDQ